MSYLRSFLPWIVYAVVSGNSASAKQWGALAALAVAVVIVLAQLRGGRGPDALIIEIGSAAFFAALAALAYAAPHSGLLNYSTALSSGALAVIAWGSLAIRRPFTLGIARQSVPRELWRQPLFIHTNVVITTVWAVCFTLSAAVLTLVVHAGGGVTDRTIVQVAAIVIPMIFTTRYAASVRARAQHHTAEHHTAEHHTAEHHTAQGAQEEENA